MSCNPSFLRAFPSYYPRFDTMPTVRRDLHATMNTLDAQCNHIYRHMEHLEDEVRVINEFLDELREILQPELRARGFAPFDVERRGNRFGRRGGRQLDPFMGGGRRW